MTAKASHGTLIGDARGGHVMPYVAMWSGERKLPAVVIALPRGGVGYLDESASDRDSRGVLWMRYESRPGVGKLVFGDVHSLRQRRVMRRLLCQVCAGVPDRNTDGVLWVMSDYRDDWAGWPNGMATHDAPVCRPCARAAAKRCPALRERPVFFRSKTHPLVGVRGAHYAPSPQGPVAVGDITVAFDDPRIRWTIAHQLIRQLGDCMIIGSSVEQL